MISRFAFLVVIGLTWCSDLINGAIDPELKSTLECMQNSILNVQRQLMDHQMNIEERTRMEGQSGIKQSRVSWGGTKPYYRESYVGRRIASIHNHPDHARTMGLGEFVVVLNGVQFTTRHNDYELRMPDVKNKSFLATTEIPFPEVPPSVLNQPNVSAEIEEMREYFRAFKDSNPKHRDYLPYFKPVLVYLEGYWTEANHTMSDFKSLRHNYNGKTWEDMWQKYRFAAESGRKNAKENLAYLPTKLYDPNGCSDMSDMNSCNVQVAHWNYRIVAHPIPFDIPLNHLKIVREDMASLMYSTHNNEYLKMFSNSAARFRLSPFDEPYRPRDRKVRTDDRLDEIFNQIPGLNNGGTLVDEAFDIKVLKSGSSNKPLNPANYHRNFIEDASGAMGSKDRFRFFNDDQMFMAMNTQSPVAKICLNNSCRKCKNKCVCQRWSYAIPLEIVFMTPLSNWNPYKLAFHPKIGRKSAVGVPDADNRNGSPTDKSKAFNGTDVLHFFRTPSDFYSGISKNEIVDKADTNRRTKVGVLDQNGELRLVAPSGHWRMLPTIKGVGNVRQRFPIMPIHIDGGGLGKEVRALQDVVMKWKTHKNLYEESLNCPS